MNKPENSIRFQTREYLFTAIVDLMMRETPMSQLTVKEIVHRAGVGRRTFYSYFASIEDAVHKCVQEMNKGIIDELVKIENLDHGAMERILFTHWHEHRRMLHVFFSEPDINMYEIFSDFLFYIGTRFEEEFTDTEGLNRGNYLKHFIVGGVYSILVHWVSSENELSTEEITALFSSFMAALHAIQTDE